MKNEVISLEQLKDGVNASIAKYRPEVIPVGKRSCLKHLKMAADEYGWNLSDDLSHIECNKAELIRTVFMTTIHSFELSKKWNDDAFKYWLEDN